MADLDGDTLPDLVTANWEDEDVSVLLNLSDAIETVPRCGRGFTLALVLPPLLGMHRMRRLRSL